MEKVYLVFFVKIKNYTLKILPIVFVKVNHYKISSNSLYYSIFISMSI